MKWLLALGLCAGCNQVFGLEKTKQIDAGFVPPDAPDSDLDEVADFEDNCPGIFNPRNKLDGKQPDADGDGVGDACDNCPAIANAQADEGDHDGIGDACDPNPISTGDCLLLFDGFNDPDNFSTYWDVEPTSTTRVIAALHSVTIAAGGQRTGFLSKDMVGTDVVSIQIVGKRPNPISMIGEVGVATIADATFKMGYHGFIGTASNGGSGLSMWTDVYATSSPPPPAEGRLSTAPVISDLVLRLEYVVSPTQGFALRGRGDYGVAVGVSDVTSTVPYPEADRNGVFANGTQLEVYGVAMYRNVPGGCPTKIIR